MRFVFGNVPPQDEGGFHFPQSVHGSIQHITASTCDELIKNVERFRMDNAMEVGDPYREVNDYLCGRWPRYCVADENKPADESPENKTLRQRTTNWRYNRYAQAQQNTELVSDTEAARRGTICMGCPKNQDNRTGCPSCVSENDRVLFMLRGGRNLPSEISKNLGGCQVTGQDNHTAAFFAEERLGYSKPYKDELPGFCWMK